MEHAPDVAATVYTGSQTFAYVLVVFVAVLTLFSLSLCYRSLRHATGWSLTDALSEEVTLSQIDSTGAPVLLPQDAAGAPAVPAPAAPPAAQTVMVTTLKASSSRFIALIGTISILMLYLGFGLAYLDRFVMVGDAPQIDTITHFFYAGIVLFAPYIVNKFASVFSYFN